MGQVEKIQQEVQALSPAELAQFRAWFLEYDWAVWDRQLERDVQTPGMGDGFQRRGLCCGARRIRTRRWSSARGLPKRRARGLSRSPRVRTGGSLSGPLKSQRSLSGTGRGPRPPHPDPLPGGEGMDGPLTLTLSPSGGEGISWKGI
jgi:hypothetical protein